MSTDTGDLLAFAFDANAGESEAAQNQNIMRRAVEIGMDPYTDSKLYWIAEQSLKAKLPEEWIECKTDEGDTYYFNLRTEDSTWEHPSLDHYRQLYAKVKSQKSVGNNSGRKEESLPAISKEKGKEEAKSPQGPVPASKNKRLQEKVTGDSNFWRSRYEAKEAEADKLNDQVKRLEKDLQESLLTQAHLVEEKHKILTLSEDCGGKLRSASTQILKHLGRRGFTVDPRRSPGDIDILNCTDDAIRVIETLVEIDEGNRDEIGFSILWEGALARVKKELDKHFTYDGEKYQVEEVELKLKVEDLTQMLIGYGAYVSQDNKQHYIDMFVDHMLTFGGEQTMVPLEMVSHASEHHVPSQGRLDYILDSPLKITELRKAYDTEVKRTAELTKDLELRHHDIEVLNTKITGLQERIQDMQNHEDTITNKFDMLWKTIDEMKNNDPAANVPKSNMKSAQELKASQKQITTLNQQLDLANKRAGDAERRLEEMLKKESEMRSELTSLELNLRLKLDKRTAKCHEIAEKKRDLEAVVKELYNELQNALLVSTRLEEDNNNLREEIQCYRGDENEATIVREKLQIEYERMKSKEESLSELQKEISVYAKENADYQKRIEELKTDVMELQEDIAGVQAELEKQRTRNEILIKDNVACEDIILKLKREITRLNDKIVDIKGSIKVFCRVRPMFEDEFNKLGLTGEDLETFIRFPDYNILDINAVPYEFDRVFSPAAAQGEVYDEIESYVRSVMNGCKTCIFGYGQSSTGKTYTLQGHEENTGLNSRALETIFNVAKLEDDMRTEVSISILEVYNETIRDLLSLEETPEDETLDIRIGKNGPFVDGLSEWPVRCIEEAESLAERAILHRQATNPNYEEHCARSHLVVTIKVERLNVRNGQSFIGYLYSVDLAGSERIKLINATGARLREAQNINKSLGALSDVISALATGQRNIPYRNSKLTFLLQDALKPHSKVLMFVNISPSPEHTGESLASLQFASRCRNVDLGPVRRNVTYQATATDATNKFAQTR